MTDTTISHNAPDGPQPTATEDAHTIMINRVSWGGILAGVVVALVVQVLLTMLCVGIGAATLDPGSGDSPQASTFSIVSLIWYAVAGIVAAFAGGCIAARISGRTVATTGKRTYIMTARRMISGLLWSYLKGSRFVMGRGYEAALPASTGFLLTGPARPPLGHPEVLSGRQSSIV